MQDKIQIDIGVGDLARPQEGIIPSLKYKGQPIFQDVIKLFKYPAEAIFSEKLETIVSKGSINSRMKDYHDLFLMIQEHGLLDLESLRDAIANTFDSRETALQVPISFDEGGMQILQQLWAGHIRGLADHKERLNIPDKINVVVDRINNYLVEVVGI